MDFCQKKTRSDRYLVIECFGLNGIVTFSYQIENSVIITGKALGTVSISALTKDHAYCGVMGMKNTEMCIGIERY